MMRQEWCRVHLVILHLVITNFTAKISCSSDGLIGSSDHVLVGVNISLAVVRELSQHQSLAVHLI